MASSSLSKRRGPLRRPKVCYASPNPGRCHPPPPPPSWPATCFVIHVEYNYNVPGGTETDTWSEEICYDEGLEEWKKALFPPDNATVVLAAGPPWTTFVLRITGTNPFFGGYWVEVYAEPFVSPSVNTYVITVWDFESGSFNWFKATFDF